MSDSDLETPTRAQVDASPTGTSSVLVGVLLLAIAIGSVTLVLANSMAV